jgi:Ca2+/Na+ antiporter
MYYADVYSQVAVIISLYICKLDGSVETIRLLRGGVCVCCAMLWMLYSGKC